MALEPPPPGNPPNAGQPRRAPERISQTSRILVAHKILSSSPDWVLVVESEEGHPKTWQSSTSAWLYRQGFEVARRLESDGRFRVYARHPFTVPALLPLVE